MDIVTGVTIKRGGGGWFEGAAKLGVTITVETGFVWVKSPKLAPREPEFSIALFCGAPLIVGPEGMFLRCVSRLASIRFCVATDASALARDAGDSENERLETDFCLSPVEFLLGREGAVDQ